MTKETTRAFVDAAAVTLKDYYDELMDQLCKTMEAKFDLMDERFRSQERALELQMDANNKKFEQQNEWRGAMNDREKAYITRQDHDALVLLLNTKEENLKKDIKSLEITRATLDGKANQSQVTTNFLLAAAGLIIAIVSLVLGFFGH